MTTAISLLHQNAQCLKKQSEAWENAAKLLRAGEVIISAQPAQPAQPANTAVADDAGAEGSSSNGKVEKKKKTPRDPDLPR